MRPALAEVIAILRRSSGDPPRREPKGAFEMVLWENAAYLVPDDVRAEVYARLVRQIGSTPEAIAGASPAALEQAIAGGGMLPAHRADKLRRAAEIARGLATPLDTLVKKDLASARKALKKMPSIGAPGADKIALFVAGHAVMPLESNGLRVLVRLGFAKEDAKYDKTLASVSAALAGEVPEKAADRVRAYLLLREHGKSICKRTKPACDACALAPSCPSAGLR